jgi:hypothetical protein
MALCQLTHDDERDNFSASLRYAGISKSITREDIKDLHELQIFAGTCEIAARLQLKSNLISILYPSTDWDRMMRNSLRVDVNIVEETTRP